MGDLVETDLCVIGAGSSGLAVAAGAGTAASSGRFRPLDQAGIPWRRITSDGGLLPSRELDEVLGLTGPAGDVLIDNRTGKNGRHWHDGIVPPVRLRSPLATTTVNDADRLARDPAMRCIVGGNAVNGRAASTSQMGRFETGLLATDENLAASSDLGGTWINRVHDRRPPRTIVLDMDSSASPTYGAHEGTAYNGHFGCTCYHPSFVLNQFGDLEGCALRPANVQ
jgi:hypothetical protein